MAINLVMSANPGKIRSGDCQQKYQIESVDRIKGKCVADLRGWIALEGSHTREGRRQARAEHI